MLRPGKFWDSEELHDSGGFKRRAKIPSEVQSVSVTGHGAENLLSWWIEPPCQADIKLIVNHTIGSSIPRRLVQLAGFSGGVLFRILVLGSRRITTVYSPSPVQRDMTGYGISNHIFKEQSTYRALLGHFALDCFATISGVHFAAKRSVWSTSGRLVEGTDNGDESTKSLSLRLNSKTSDARGSRGGATQ